MLSLKKKNTNYYNSNKIEFFNKNNKLLLYFI